MAGLTDNLEKCEFRRKKIEFFGQIFPGEGVSPDPKKVADLHRAAEPKNVSEVHSFLGMAQYSTRHIKDFVTVTVPFQTLTKQDNDLQCGKKELKAFNAVKAGLAESATTSSFDAKKANEIVVDASPVGLAALLVQEKTVVVYRSRAWSDMETCYSQTKREALLVVWACEHFDKFINGVPQFSHQRPRATGDRWEEAETTTSDQALGTLSPTNHTRCSSQPKLRTKVWFPEVDTAVEEAVKCCIPCQVNTICQETELLSMLPLPDGPWSEISIDFCGPLPTGEYLWAATHRRVSVGRYPQESICGPLPTGEYLWAVTHRINGLAWHTEMQWMM